MSKIFDRYWPRMTDVERANYLARRELEKNAPAPRWAVMLCGMLLLAIPLVYCAMANAGPVVVAPMAGAVVAQRNNQHEGPARSEIEKLADACIRDLSKCPKEERK